MLWVLSFHIIAMVAWFAGLFYLPRLFVYHTQAHDTASKKRFCVMERKLFYYIMTPAGIVTSLLGFWLLLLLPSLSTAYWLHFKLLLVFFLWLYHGYCMKIVADFDADNNKHSETFYRFFNEIPTVLLIGIVILAIVKP